jgi:hypothetical protein
MDGMDDKKLEGGRGVDCLDILAILAIHPIQAKTG